MFTDKLKLSDWNELSLRIILLFVTAMAVSYSPDYLREFFADTKKPDDLNYYRGMLDEHWEWGFRHYLYFWMCILLFVVQAIKIFKWSFSDDRKFKV